MSTEVPDRIAGKLLDADAHLYLEPEVMAGLLEPIGGDWLIEMLAAQKLADGFRDEKLRAESDVWGVKGLAARGACDPTVRLETMDQMGVVRQLAFPNTLGREARSVTAEARLALSSYNNYALDWTLKTKGRSIGVCALNTMGRDFALVEARRVLGAGAQAIALSVASPPGGTSLANPAWDELWHMVCDAQVPVLLHVGGCGIFSGEGEDPILMPRALWDAPSLRSAFPNQPGSEERIGPIWAVIAPLPVELLLTSLVMGGVFERFPTLRFGIIEFGAQWLGPLVERMDMHAKLLRKVGASLPLLPSEYVRRNLRVTPFWSEPVDLYIERYGLSEVYVFSTDFPHIEGGRDPVGSFLDGLNRLGPEVVDGFFVENAKLLMP